MTGYKGNYFNFLQGDAENFYSKAKKKGLTLTSYPVAGGIMVWSKGKTGVNKDGAGHVAVVEIDYGKDATKVYTSNQHTTVQHFLIKLAKKEAETGG
ncbi:MAG: CHAP domain-containing protein [Clostridium sp.]|nr:MAG: CHAP domain-containing protein [Clostridium sp.]